MRALDLTLLILSMLFANGPRALGEPRVLTPQDSKYIKSLKTQCDDGNGQSCFDYAHVIEQINPGEDEKAAPRLIRRACMLAYQPACERKNLRTVSGEKKPQASCGVDAAAAIGSIPKNLPDGTHGTEIISVAKNSLMEKAGVRPGDVISKINGSEFTNPTQLSKALDGGNKVQIDLTRGGAAFTLSVACP